MNANVNEVGEGIENAKKTKYEVKKGNEECILVNVE